ncbi:hypothetical protein SUGI_0181290 [Cryptomeria japonica]|uniref:cysteine-rich receptor-like protein kinase 25 n=1 Tax=Cryptomeria japonica TaxID=3369 RepID=UPI002408A9B2|nr:cysteine-rich receptor-like protein kinase 25 [Cryptomeria japonica]GLJ11974.1 hypothetical protein SUGI_0181290 [Cryptomeria japonica]
MELRSALCTVVFLLWMKNFPTRTDGALAQVCNANRYSNGSEFEVNVKRVLAHLERSASESWLEAVSAGENGSPNQVFGLFQCRGDVSRKDCQSCAHEAVVEAYKTCPGATGALVWLELCFLRYQDSNFTSDVKSQDIVGSVCNNVAVPNLGGGYTLAIRALMKNLALKASLPGNRGFASGQSVDSSGDTIFGLVQCLQLPFVNCSQCVSDAIEGMPENCLSDSGGQILVGSCHIRFGKDKFFSSPVPLSSQQTTSFHQPSTSISNTHEKSKNKLPIKLIITMAVLGGLFLILVYCLIKLSPVSRRGEVALFKSMRHDQEAQEDNSEEALSQQEQIIFEFKTLKLATKNFHDDNKVGEGGFGPVYKGILLDGRQIAVKKLSLNSKQGKNEFLNEVKIVAKIQHRNLVKLLGCCTFRTEKLLVYEYMPNNSLEKMLFDAKKRQMLDWSKRYNIIIGVARGLLYLHEDSQPRIIHRDIKASNILLDENLNPKISDFGMARLVGENTTQINARIAGTYGYMAPEYALRGELSIKVDIFSFGVLLLEILSGRKNTDISLPSNMQILLHWAWGLYIRGKGIDIMDPMLGEVGQGELERCIHIGLLCAQADETARPSMSSVFLMLSSDSIALPLPTIPGFVHVAQSVGNSTIFPRDKDADLSRISIASNSSSHSPLVVYSRNDISITLIEGR